MSQQAPLRSRTTLLVLGIGFYCKRCTWTGCTDPCPHAHPFSMSWETPQPPPIHKKSQRQPHGHQFQPTAILTPKSSTDTHSELTHNHILWELIKTDLRPYQADSSQRPPKWIPKSLWHKRQAKKQNQPCLAQLLLLCAGLEMLLDWWGSMAWHEILSVKS